MLFKHPEILYALFLLIIPVLVHLFQLRQFREEPFTNVKFLKKASLRSRKSSRIKKWLILCTRLLLLASIIIAFTQPYFPSSKKAVTGQETVIYLDNSYSMQAKGTNGILLKRSVQELLEHLPEKQSFSLFFNTGEFKNVTLNDIREDLQEISYSQDQLDWKSVKLKAENLFSENLGLDKNFIAISDFQKKGNADNIEASIGIQTHLVQIIPENRNNISIDTAFIYNKTLDETELEIHISESGEILGEIPVSVYDSDKLMGRKSVSVNEDQTAVMNFKFPSAPVENGKITIEDAGLTFDNELNFSINRSEPIKVAVINNADAFFLERIYQYPEFDLEIFNQDQVDFNNLGVSNLIILNEVEEIPVGLTGIIQKLISEDVFLIIIPSGNAYLQNYNSFFRNSGSATFKEKVEQERLITEISFSHPLFENVFDSRVENFQYPKVQSYFPTNGNEIPVLSFENKQAFLFQKGNIYVFTASLDLENSDFKSSPLIVPTFFNIGNLALAPSLLYYNLGENNTLDVKVNLEPDEILKLTSEEFSFIPLQQSFQNKVEIELNEYPDASGHFNIEKDSASIKTLSFNVPRDESRLEYHDLGSLKGVKLSKTIPNVFREINSESQIHSLWKWFVIFALFFLLTEMLILKYFK